MDNSEMDKTKNSDKPTSFDDKNKPIPFDDADLIKLDEEESSNISHTPLDLGGSNAAGKAAEIVTPKSSSRRPRQQTASTERVTGCKTFFGKLHIGSIDFLAEQINDWLKANPNIVIKQTNTTTGNVVGKTTEPNLIVTVWY